MWKNTDTGQGGLDGLSEPSNFNLFCVFNLTFPTSFISSSPSYVSIIIFI
jgi:hypothetical protein